MSSNHDSFSAKDGGPKDTNIDGEGTWAEIVLGGDFQKKWKLNAGVRIRF